MKMFRPTFILLLVLVCFFYGNVSSQSNFNKQEEFGDSQRLKWAPGQVILKIKDKNGQLASLKSAELQGGYDKIAKAAKNIGINTISIKPMFSKKVMLAHDKVEKSGGIGEEMTLSNYVVLNVSKDTNIEDVIGILESDENTFIQYGFEIEKAEPNYLLSVNSVIPNDKHYGGQWGVKYINCEEAWEITKGSKDVKVAVIDLGVDLEHEDLKANISTDSYDFVDIDEGLYVGQFGYSLIEGQDYFGEDSIPADYDGHGTHVAGIIGAVQNNSVGISGVCPDVTLMVLRAGFTLYDSRNDCKYSALEVDDVINAMVYAADNDADIINMSFDTQVYSDILHEHVRYAAAKGVTLVAAAGNFPDDRYYYPAAFKEVIAVSSNNRISQKSELCRFGSWIDVIAPGDDIYSTVPSVGGDNTHNSGYKYLSGTSMSTPMISGVVALLKSVDQSLSEERIRSIIRTSVNFPKDEGVYYGEGIVDAHKALLSLDKEELTGSFIKPEENRTYFEDLNIVGSHNGELSNFYIGVGNYPQEWDLLKDSIKEKNFDFVVDNNLPSDIYTLKMEVCSQIDTVNFYRRFTVGSNENMMEGWPVELNTISENDPSSSYESITVADLDGDGKQEIIVVSNLPKNSNGYFYSHAMYVLDYKGKMVEGWPYVFPDEANRSKKPVVLDIDNDGLKEIITVSVCGKDFVGKQQLIILNPNGSVEEGWPRHYDMDEQDLSFAVADLNLDGKKEIILGSGTRSCGACAGEGIVHVVGEDGEYLSGWPVTLETNYVPRSPFSITNIDEDPELEIAFTRLNLDKLNVDKAITSVYNFDGSLAREDTLMSDSWGFYLSSADFDQDGISEIISSEGAYNKNGSLIDWGWNLRASSPITIANVDDDPEPEICCAIASGNPALINFDGTFVPGWPVREDGIHGLDLGMIVADVAGDFKPEIMPLYTTYFGDATIEKPGLNVYNSDGTVVDGFPRFRHIYKLHDLEVADLDNDGDVEIVGFDAEQNTIFALDMPKQHNRNLQEWPTKYGDCGRTNTYSYKNEENNVSPVITGQKRVVIREDFVLPVLADLTVEDSDNTYPADFYLEVQDDVSYDHENNLVYPKEDVQDSMIVYVVVSDGVIKSDVFPMVVYTPKYLSAPELHDLEEIKIYPNPFDSEINVTINLSSFEAVKIDLIDISGKTIDQVYNDKPSGIVQFSYQVENELKSGVYFMRVSSDSSSYCRKLIKR